jgi:sugar O-acyltransferase (sialic acid O-acetyltransferase NeuD family)
MKDIIIFGAGGLGQEVLWNIETLNSIKKEWNVIGFSSELEIEIGKEFHGYEIFKPEDVKVKYAALAFADPINKERFHKKYKDRNFIWPNLIHPDVLATMKVTYDGEGIIIFARNTLMPCSKIKSFTYMNVNCVIGHDTVIDEYVSIAPGALVMGNCTIGKSTYIGVGAATREKIHIGNYCFIGANAAVISDIPDYSVAAGCPAKVIKKIKGV